MAKRHLGRRYAPDARDLKFQMVRKLGPVGSVLPSRKTWGTRPTALDQGNTGTCVGHAWANFLRAVPIQTNAGIDSLRWEIYDEAVKIDEWRDNDNDTERQFGTSIRAGAQVVTSMGRIKSYLWAFELQPAIEWVLTMGPVVLGTNWYNNFFRPDSAGILSIGASSVVGGHAYLCRGVDTKRALALCSNSWGDDWGKSGEFYIPFRVLERLIHEEGECCAAIEQKLKKSKS
jgi:hypothetical protein